MKKEVKIGSVTIGGKNRVAVQSMTNTATSDVDAVVKQINELDAAGCDIVRFSVPDTESALAVEKIKEQTDIPLVADIHFDYKLALMCIERGIDKVRINPGNIGGEDRAEAVARAARLKNIPIRIGVNGGSLEKGLLEECGGDLAMAMVKSAERHAAILNKFDFDDIVLSMKSSKVSDTVRAYRLASERFDYPLHLGVTEAGTARQGIIKSAVGIGSLLLDGIGDTIRVSLTDDPVLEVRTAQLILRSLDMGGDYVEVVSCPTCGRTKIDLIKAAKQVNDAVEGINKKLKVAVMGCVVNGPGEAKDADIGIAGGDGCAVLFKHGEIIRKIDEDEIVPCLLEEIEAMTKQ
ncbi:MAG TPA: flavodoxin-dependent (E)-4-hydroxy-3-methylbut-2-enyl-diphosphate synthase [Candidatus Monoglobus merdigallinarum]|uniref:4-hydroxy-3-methylbut-2-en-1-yl diphosphate synthase (flavodoxin) n=1 Tax=Candidatus Monoglobus merdigallinarum TaxID=2838698 RepID=A0A9D1PRU2_9FIRM|nr:flavodoxin-dependent (E)-4-hydroxy-3-methylbut-2-enyl-diphosphate synthase [Candidatus Monoglobus merdigallinarum]